MEHGPGKNPVNIGADPVKGVDPGNLLSFSLTLRDERPLLNIFVNIWPWQRYALY